MDDRMIVLRRMDKKKAHLFFVLDKKYFNY